jgi:Kinesin motor domain
MLSDGQNFCSVIKVNNQDRDHVSNEIHLVEYLGLAVDE